MATLVALTLAACRQAEKKISVRQRVDQYFIIFNSHSSVSRVNFAQTVK
jgi:hypothetical protein